MLDGLPTELLDSIEVYKTLTADQDADSIGGRIEFNTKRATSLDKTLLKQNLIHPTMINQRILIILKLL